MAEPQALVAHAEWICLFTSVAGMFNLESPSSHISLVDPDSGRCFYLSGTLWRNAVVSHLCEVGDTVFPCVWAWLADPHGATQACDYRHSSPFLLDAVNLEVFKMQFFPTSGFCLLECYLSTDSIHSLHLCLKHCL